MDEESKDQPAAVEDGVSPDAAPTEEAEPEVEDIPDEDKEEVVEKIMTEDKEEVAETTYEASAAISEAPTDDAVAAPIEVVAAAPEEEEPPPYAAAASYSAPAKEKTSSSPFATADEGYWPAVEEGEMEVASPKKEQGGEEEASAKEETPAEEDKGIQHNRRESANLTPTLAPAELHEHPPTLDEITAAESSGESGQPADNFASLEQAVKVMEESAAHTRDALHLLKRRAQIEETYAKALKALHAEATADKVTSFRSLGKKIQGKTRDEVGERAGKAWSAVLSQLQQTADLHAAFAERVVTGAVAPLKKTMDEVEATRKEVEKGAAKLNRDLKEAQRKVERATEAADKAAQAAVQAAAAAAGPAKPASTGERMFSLFKKAPPGQEIMDAEKYEAARKCNVAQQLCHSTIPQYLSQLEGGEASRLRAMHDALADLTAGTLDSSSSVQALCPTVSEAVSAMDANADSSEFLASVTGNGGAKAW